MIKTKQATVKLQMRISVNENIKKIIRNIGGNYDIKYAVTVVSTIY